MCSLAPRAAAPGFSAAAFLHRQRGVVAAVAPAATRNAAEPPRRSRDFEVSTGRAQKRGRDDTFEHDVVEPASSSALRVRMEKELVALQALVKQAKQLPQSTPPAVEKKYAPPPRRSEAPSAAAKRTTRTSQPNEATEAAYQARITAPAANLQQQQRPVQQAAAKKPIVPEVPNTKPRPAEAPAAAKQHQHPVQRQRAAADSIAEADARKTRRPEEEEVARAAEREAFRQMLLDVEKAALPDETIYPEDLEELGITFEFVVTRTRKQALLEDNAKKRAAAKNPIALEVPDNKNRPPAEAPAAAKQRPVKVEALKLHRPAEEELAHAKATAKTREEFRRMLQDMEKAVPPDEMVYPEELEELGIVPRHGGRTIAV